MSPDVCLPRRRVYIAASDNVLFYPCEDHCRRQSSANVCFWSIFHARREHNTAILKRMVLEDGGVLKPPANALPCLKSLFVDPQRDPDALLSIWNECEAPGHGVVVSAIANAISNSR